MAKIVKENLPITKEILSRADALKMFKDAGQDYKVELIQDLPEDAVISLYRQGDFYDLCAGPHCESTGRVKAFKIQTVAGAYWRGDEKNKMLQRIYGTAFEKKSELDDYLKMMEEAEKRDHRKLGKQLGLFMLSEYGPGVPVLPPQGHDRPQPAHRLLARSSSPLRLSAGHDPDDHEPRTLGNFRSLGSLQRKHVLHQDRR